jgi:hypothetical protein
MMVTISARIAGPSVSGVDPRARRSPQAIAANFAD